MREIEANLLNEDFVDLLKALRAYRVESLLVGSYAVILHSYHRTTGALDIWVNPSQDNYERLRAASTDFGLPLNAISQNEFLDQKTNHVHKTVK
ncbi:MAG: hypothetical protein AAGH40_08095 [Verrucomicrobiota bacterium]